MHFNSVTGSGSWLHSGLDGRSSDSRRCGELERRAQLAGELAPNAADPEEVAALRGAREALNARLLRLHDQA